ncbi:MAG: DNA primase [Deltaproteobacteria bacterium]|nr:DNA primase [Deltaproteobacteria bacterium]
MIPDEVISQIREAADIVAVIGQHIQLKKAGRSWKGLCPFHGEKTPSFNVMPDKGFFHCFGCQKSGDVFTFVMELEGKSFVEAAEHLGARFGIEIPKLEESPELRRARGERVAMLDLNKLAAAFFREILADPTRGAPGRAYLEKRGVSQETVDKFQLGYAPGEWGALADHLRAKRADLELAVRLGLIAHRPKTSGFYDRNRDRLVCPVVQPGGEIAGFSARVVGTAPVRPGDDPPPKYINSPESPVYKKSKLLFGLAQAREAMATTKRVVLVEGNFDVITLHQAGFCEVVAPLGTALTPEQVNVLRRMSDRIVLLYDGDKAGYKATMHALQLCVEAEVEVQVASRPGHARSGGAGPLAGGVDPDSLVAGGGAEVLREAVDRARGGIDFFAYEVWSMGRNNVDARARALSDAAGLAAKVASPAKRDLIVGTLASALHVDAEVVRSAFDRARGRPQPSPQTREHGARVSERTNEAPRRWAQVGERDELELIALLTDHPSLIATADADRAFCLLTDTRLRDMYSAARDGQSLLELASSRLPPDAAAHVLSGMYSQKDPTKVLAVMLSNLEHRRAMAERARLGKQLAQSGQRNEHETARLLAQLAVAKRQGDRELVARLTDEIATNRKQVD